MSDKTFFSVDPVNYRYNKLPHTNIRLLTMIDDRGFKSIQQFADKCGVSRSRMSLIIHNHQAPGHTLMLKIAKILDCDSRLLWPDREKVEQDE